MKVLKLTIIFLFITSYITYSQNWLETVDQKTDFSYKTLDKSFTDYWSDKEPYKGSGFKQYKRLEWYVKPRFWNTDGIPDLAKIYKKSSNFMLESFEWKSLGPKVKPEQHPFYSKAGTGRLSCIDFDPTDNRTIYVGAATGGIWKTTD